MRRSPAPWVALITTLLLTLAATFLIAFVVGNRDDVRFNNARRATESQIRVRLNAYIAALRAADGFFAAAGYVDRDEFEEYVSRLDLQREYPGIQGIGYAQRVTPRQIRDLEEDARAAGFSYFEVWPKEPRRGEYFPIVYLQPPHRRNRAALGFDMFSDTIRREAMERARDTGQAALSGRVRLIQELDDPQPQPGFLIYQPVFRPGPLPSTEDARRRALTGFVYSPFRAVELFEALLAEDRDRQLVFRVYDGEVTDTASLLFDSRPDPVQRARQPSRRAEERVLLGGRSWTLVFETLPGFESGSSEPLIPLIAVIGVLVSFLMFRVTRDQVEARAKAERSEAMRGRFFAMMSHELRTPINAILGYNDLLLTGVYGELPAPQAHGIERSQKAARHLAELVNDVLDLSKIEARKLHLEFEDVAVGETIEDLLTTIRPLAEERGCALEVLPCSCSGPVFTDPRRLRQILLNLLSNATKFGAGQPVRVRCMDAPEGGGVVIEVIDCGPGIDPHDLDRIFEEFVQLERGTREGTGLGLAISRRLASLLGGRLSAESVPGGGSTFRLWLPARPPRAH